MSVTETNTTAPMTLDIHITIGLDGEALNALGAALNPEGDPTDDGSGVRDVLGDLITGALMRAGAAIIAPVEEAIGAGLTSLPGVSVAGSANVSGGFTVTTELAAETPAETPAEG
jgi:hypothetical protein